MLYQYDGGSKLSIDIINDTNAFRALVNEYLSSTGGSGLFLWNKLVQTKRRHFITVSSLNDSELLMTKCRHFKGRIIFNIVMKLTTTTA